MDDTTTVTRRVVLSVEELNKIIMDHLAANCENFSKTIKVEEDYDLEIQYIGSAPLMFPNKVSLSSVVITIKEKE